MTEDKLRQVLLKMLPKELVDMIEDNSPLIIANTVIEWTRADLENDEERKQDILSIFRPLEDSEKSAISRIRELTLKDLEDVPTPEELNDQLKLDSEE